MPQINPQKAREIMSGPSWPPEIEEIPETASCHEAASGFLGFTFEQVIGESESEDEIVKKVFRFYEEAGASPRRINSPEEKLEYEYILVVYSYFYTRPFLFFEMDFHEVHFARINPDGIAFEKASPHPDDLPHYGDIADFNAVIAADAVKDKGYGGPVYIAFSRPH